MGLFALDLHLLVAVAGFLETRAEVDPDLFSWEEHWDCDLYSHLVVVDWMIVAGAGVLALEFCRFDIVVALAFLVVAVVEPDVVPRPRRISVSFVGYLEPVGSCSYPWFLWPWLCSSFCR